MSRIKDLTLAVLRRKSGRRNAPVSDLLHRIDIAEKAGAGIRGIRAEAGDSVTFRPNPKVRAETEERPMDRVAGKIDYYG